MKDQINIYGNGGMSVSGPNAMRLYAAITLKHALLLYYKTSIRPSRNVTPTSMLKLAEGYTGKKYKRGEYRLAAEDLDVWVEATRPTIPVEDNRV